MNILVTSAGRRSYLIKYFKEALGNRGIVIAANSVDKVPSFAEADQTVVTPMIYDPDYISFLLKYCEKKKIDAIVPLYDVDLPVLAHHKDMFEKIGARLIVSDEKFVRICNDKWNTYIFLKENGFSTPKTYLHVLDAKRAIEENEISFPLMIKPRFGNGSIALNIATDEKELEYLFSITQKEIRSSWLKFESSKEEDIVVIQEFVSGEEYGIDIMNDLDGTYQNVVIKKKIAMRSGETDSAIIVDNDDIRQQMKKLAEITRHVANLDCDGFLKDNVFYILEMNARFGGGYPFSHVAGVNMPLAIVKWLRGEEVNKNLLTAQVGVRAYKDINIKRWKEG